MLPTTLILLLVAPFTAYAQCTKSTTNSCSTVMATVPPWWPVLTFTATTQLKTTTLTGTTTLYVNKTVAAVPITVNSTTTTTLGVTTTATPGTNTAYYTQTVTVTTAGTVTTITTGTVTSTVISTSTSWSTAIVTAPSGFISAYGSSGDSNYAGSKRAAALRSDLKARTRYELEKRGWLSDLLNLFGVKTTSTTANSKKPAASLPRFNALDWINPVAVNCIAQIAPTCRVGATITSTLTTTAAPSTLTSTIQATAFSTKVVIPGNVTSTITIATSTATFSTSVLVTSTAITTVTTTLTSIVTSVTSTYAACATSNILGSRIASGGAISKVYFYDSSAVVATTPQVSPYDCCVACQTGNNCQFFQYTGSNGQCYVIGGDANWCPNNQQDYSTPAYFTYDDVSNVQETMYVGNGVCGTVMDAGHV